jgi:hypothetical protein
MDGSRIKFFIIDVLFLHDILHYSEAIIRIIDDKVLTIPDPIDEHTQEKRRRRMKCSHHRETMLSKRVESIRIETEFHSNSSSHFFGGFVGKGHTKYRSRINMSLVYHRNNSFGDGMSFSGSSSSIDQEWSVYRIDGDLLLGIEHVG